MAELAALKASAPGGRRSELEKAQEQRELRAKASKATMFQAVTRSAAAAIEKLICAGMAELADALDLGSSAKSVQVRPLLPAPKIDKFRKKLVDFYFFTINSSLFTLLSNCRFRIKDKR